MALTDNPNTYDVAQFETILVTACDIHGIAKGRFVFRESVPGIVKNGLGMTQASLFGGVLCDIPTNLVDYSQSGWTNGTILPCVSTLKPLSWLLYGGRKVGHMLCDLLDQSYEREVSSSREVALRQIVALNALGYDILTAYDLEFTIFHKGTLNPVDLHEDTSKLVLTLTTALLESGLPVVSVGRGMEPGQLLISLSGQLGIAASDSFHQLHSALKSLCVKEGYEVTRMTRPLDDVSGNRSSYSIALITAGGRNAFVDTSSKENLSDVGCHWMAGLLHHNAAIMALARPTLNCYPLTMDKQDRLQIRPSCSNVFIADKLPSSAGNPYNVIGALIAAGIDGINNKLELVEKTSAESQPQPASLSEALLSLENDKVLQEAIGAKFVHRYLVLKREFEIGRLENRKAENKAHDLEFERSLYLWSL